MLTWWLVTALAAPCPDLPTEVDAGWAAYHDAELGLAREHIAQGITSLSCQEQAVSTEQLLRLYRLDALVAITQSDRKGAVYATIRVVTIDPEAAPAEELGPELAEMHQTWSARLSENIIRVAYQGDGGAWVDGRPVESPWIEVYAGEHLFQYDGPDGWVSRVDEVDHSLTLGPPGAAPPPDPEPPEPVTGGGDEDRYPGRRVRRTALISTGVGLSVGGAALAAFGGVQEAAFKDKPFTADQYAGCTRLDDCYGDARADQIRKEAGAIRALYAVGYAGIGTGLALLGTELLLLPSPTAGGGHLQFSGRF